MDFVILQSEFAPNNLHGDTWIMDVLSQESYGFVQELCTMAVDALSQVLDEHLEKQKGFHDVWIFYEYFGFVDIWCKRLENSKKIEIYAVD